MAFEVKNIDFQTKKVVGSSEFTTSGLVSFPQDKPLTKVLSVSATANSINGEAVDTDYNFQGKINLNILYLTEENKPETLLAEIQFQHSVKAFAEDEFAQVDVLECHVEESDASYAKVSVLLYAQVVGKTTSTLAVLSGQEENYVEELADTHYTTYVSGAKNAFELSGTAEIDYPATVIYANSTVKIKSVVAGIEQATISGETKTKIGYMTENGLFEDSKVIEFSRELSIQDATPDSKISLIASAKETTFNADTDDKTKVTFVVTVQTQSSVYADKTETTIKDIFNTAREVEVTYGCSNYQNYVGTDKFESVIRSKFTFSNQGPVLLISKSAKIAKFTVNDRKIVAEGVIFANVLYKNQENLCQEEISLQFAVAGDTEMQGQAYVTDVQLDCVNISYEDKETEISFELEINYIVESDNYAEYVESVKDLGERRETTSAITIYVAKSNDTLFHVARALRVSPEQILSQNEVVDGKFAEGQRIFVYSPLVAEF